jgi:serine/threonine-protein kinase
MTKSIDKNISEQTSAVLAKIENGYTPLRFLGQGSVGTVYECVDSDGRHVAVKLMESNPMVDISIFEGIIHAALATQEIPENINVVDVLTAGKEGSDYYIIMEMMPGGTLETMVMDSSLSFSAKLESAAKIAEIIAGIHGRGIVHGDLKPENILLNAEKEPYLNDFYLYTAGESGEMPIMPFGTPYYMSPEQAKGALITPESDIYSFGVLIYELLTARMPYYSKPDNIQEMVTEIADGKIYPPSKANSKINSRLNAVILKLLEKDADNRYRNMNRAAGDLRACIDQKPISIPYNESLLEKIRSFLHLS